MFSTDAFKLHNFSLPLLLLSVTLSFILFAQKHRTMGDENATATKLLTLLNVSATTARASKRKLLLDEIAAPPVKLNKRKSVRLAEITNEPGVVTKTPLVDAQSSEKHDDAMRGVADEPDEEKDEDGE